MNVGTLYEMLDRLPVRCDDFIVRFTSHDRSYWFQSGCEGWIVDEDRDLLLSLWGEDAADDVYTVEQLKDLLEGYCNDECADGQEVFDWMTVYIERVVLDDDYEVDDRVYYEILDDRFEVNWKRGRVDVFIEYDR